MVVLWLVFVGATVWRHAARSTQPPIYDALTYASKAKHAWAAADGGRVLELLNTEPANRPPGTVLMSYPFGFDGTFHGFHFRSVFLPALLAYLAVWMAGSPEPRSRTDAWTLVRLGLCVSSMPIFFQFEYTDALPSPVYWGLVDNFTAGVSAVAAAATLRGLGRSSLAGMGVAFLASAFSFLIKPAGLLTMGLVTGCFATVAGLEALSPGLPDAEKKRRVRFLFGGLLLAIVLQGGILAAAVTSAYLSPANVSYYGEAVALLRSQMAAPVTASLLHWSIHTSIGYPLLASVFVSTALGLVRRRSGDADGDPLPSLVVGAAWLGAASFAVGCLWTLATDLTQVRYAMPSFLMGVIFLVPLVLRVSQKAPRWGRVALGFLWSLPPLGLGCLLLLGSPPVRAQRLMGVNLTSDGTAEEVRAADRLIEELRRGGRGASVYSFYSGSATAAFECVGYWRKLVEPGRSFRVRLPLDWVRPPSFRLEDIVTARYVLFSPLPDPSARRLVVSRRTIATFEEESALFHALFTDLDEAAGVRVDWDGESARLLRVTDAVALRAALTALLEGYTLRPEFLSANPELATQFRRPSSS